MFDGEKKNDNVENCPTKKKKKHVATLDNKSQTNDDLVLLGWFYVVITKTLSK